MSENLGELKAQARRLYRIWPVFLLLQIRRAQQHLDTESAHEQQLTEDSDELAIIRQMNFPLTGGASGYVLPPQESVARTGVRFWFRSGPPPDDDAVAVLDLLRLRASGDRHRRELLRVNGEDRWFADRAAVEFNQALDGYGVDRVFNAARLWASFSGAVTLPWEKVDVAYAGLSTHTSENTSSRHKKRLFGKSGKEQA